MKSLAKLVKTATKHLSESWITWVVLGAVTGTGVLLTEGLGDSEPTQLGAPSGIEIEAAVAQAEAQGNAARHAGAGR